MINTRLCAVAVAFGFILLSTAACDSYSGSGGGPAPVTAPEILIESASHCSGDGTCEKVDNPENVWLETGHTHEVRVMMPHGSVIRSSVSDSSVVEYSDGTTLPTRAEITLKGKSLGAASLDVSLDGARSGTASLNVLTVTPRVTVVAWVDGSAIHPEEIAPDAGPNVREQFRGIENASHDTGAAIRCIGTMAQLLFAAISPGTTLVFMDERSFVEDGLYAQAALVKSSGNGAPPPKLTEAYLKRRDYRLLNDFRVLGGRDRKFAKIPQQTTDVGSTPLPCGGEKMIRRFVDPEVLPEWLDAGKSDEHPMHGRRVCRWRQDKVTQISEGRIGRKGREIQRLLSGSMRAPDELTPYIWSAVNFSPDGTFSIDTQNFPTYSVFVDGELDDGWTSIQAGFTQFVSKDASSQYEVAGTDFDRGKCP